MIVSFHHANRELAEHLVEPLADQGIPVHLVGDVTGTANIQAAIHGACRRAAARLR